MSGELAPRLQASLGSSFTIVRELGGGGMSRVFLADDLALGRSVVVKVLHEELAAGVNAERFKREVQLAARLQHPHIVPVLFAGAIDGLPFYVMPFVAGESLRARLTAGPLPIAEAVSIFDDVAKALAYAHAGGVVHRDIKPDNILLSGGAATVADFGIAKAISSARRNGTAADVSTATDADALTSLGTSLGTPAYMAPEQVAGDPSIDHRADLYSLGCVAYEMLAGRSPFAGKSPQQLLAAQVMETPRPLAEARPEVPPRLAALVMRCLEKEPDHRPQSASEIVTELATMGTENPAATAGTAAREGSAARAPWSWRGSRAAWPVFVVAAVLAAIVSAIVVMKPHAPTPSAGLAVAVAPFEVLDPQFALWKEGMVDVLSRNLDGAGPIRTVSPAVTIKQWAGHGDRAAAADLGRRLGARLVVYGQLQTAGHDFVDATAWIADAAADAQPIEVQVHDSVARMDRVTDSLSVRLLAAIGRDHTIGAARLASLGSGSLPAIKAFLEGAQYYRRGQWDSSSSAFRGAIALDPTFAIAYAMLGEAIGWSETGDESEEQALFAKTGAMTRRGLSPHDTLMMTALREYGEATRAAPTQAAPGRLAVAAATALTRQYPADPQAWYLLGDIRFHTDATVPEQDIRAELDRAIDADSDFAPAYIHAIELAYGHGAAAGQRYAAAYLRHNGRDVQAAGIRLAVRLTDPTPLGEKEIQAILDTIDPRVGVAAYAALDRIPDSAAIAVQLLRVGARRLPGGPGAVAKSLANAASLHGFIQESWPAAVESGSGVAGEIAGLGLVPMDSALTVLRPWLHQSRMPANTVLPLLALARDTATLETTASSLDEALRKTTDPHAQSNLVYFIAATHAYIALARGDTAKASRLLDALPDSVVGVGFDQLLRARLIERTDPARALAILERRRSVPDLMFAVQQLERGRIAERLGERARAVDAFAYVADVWCNADAPQLRDGAKEARDALRRLDADGKLRAQLGGSRVGP